MSRLKRILSGLICVCILASAFSAFAQTQTDSVLTQVVFEGKAYENRTDFTWELHNPIPEGGVKWDGTKEFIAMADFTENQLIDTPSADSYGNQYVKNQIAFTAIDGFDFAYMQQAAADYGFRIVGYLAPTATYVIESVEDRDYYELQSIIHELQSDEKIISNTVLLRYPYEITSDAYYPSDPWGDASWDINRPEGNNWAVEAIKAPDAWEYLSIMQNINVGIIDSMFFAHPDLSFLACYDRANGSTLEDYFDKTKLLGSLHNVDYVDQVYEVLHGTHVAGTFNAVNNNIGITGVYPKGRLIGIGTFFQNRSEKEEEDIVNIIERYFKYSDDSLDKYYLLLMRANDVHVINVSLGFNNPIPQNDYLKKQDEYTNIRGWGVFFERLSRFYDFVLINSAGNKSIDAKGNYWCQLVDNEYFQNRLITVGAFGRIDANKYEFADFSNYGSSVDILAPGVKIYSTFVNPINGDYTYGDRVPGLGGSFLLTDWSGTSQAAPHVAGTAAMIWSLAPDTMTGPQVKSILLNNADYINAMTSGHSDDTVNGNPRSYPLLDAGRAVKAAVELINQPTPTIPTEPPTPTPTPTDTSTPTPTPVADELKCYRTDSMDPVYAGNIIRLELRNAKNGVVKFDVTIVNNGIYHVNTEWGLYDTAHGFEHTDTVWQFYLDDELINGAAVTVVAEDGDGRTATWSGIMAAGGEFEGYMRSDD